MTTVNFAEMLANAGQVGEPVPDGTYDIAIIGAEPKTASTGKAMIMVRCQILTGPYASRTIINNFVLSPDNPTASGFFFRHMSILGLAKEYFGAGPQIEQVCQDLLNRQARITVGTKDGRQNVNNWETVPGGQLSAMPTSQPAAFNAPAPSPMQGFAPAPQFNGQMPTPVAPTPQVYAQPAVAGPQYQQPGQPQYPQPVAPPVQPPQFAPQQFAPQAQPQADPQFLQQFQPSQAQQFAPQPQAAPPGAPDQQAAYAPTGEPYAQPAPQVPPVQQAPPPQAPEQTGPQQPPLPPF